VAENTPEGTVVSLPHREHIVVVSVRRWSSPPSSWFRFALQDLHRLGSFLKPYVCVKELFARGEYKL